MRPDITILDLGNTGDEPYVIRDLAEAYGSTTLRSGSGKASDFLSNLNEADSKYVVLSLHCDQKGLVLPELAQKIAEKEKYLTHLALEDLREELKINSSVVISTACNTGSSDYGATFLASGAKAYIAPDGYPEGNAIPF